LPDRVAGNVRPTQPAPPPAGPVSSGKFPHVRPIPGRTTKRVVPQGPSAATARPGPTAVRVRRLAPTLAGTAAIPASAPGRGRDRAKRARRAVAWLSDNAETVPMHRRAYRAGIRHAPSRPAVRAD